MSGSRSFGIAPGGGGGGSSPDADISTKGLVQLAGDLGGTAASPTVPGLAAKAPLASPALTGTPTAPTATAGTSTTQVATTAFATTADALKVDKYATQSKTASFTAAPGFVYLVDSTAGAVTVTLPAANVAGHQLVVKWEAGTNAVTVQRAGSDTIGAAATTATVQLAGEAWEITSSGSGQWNVTAGNKTLSSLDGRFSLKYAWTPADNGFLGASLSDVAVASSSAVPATAGRLEFARVRLPVAANVTNIVMFAGVAGATLTAGQCFAALFRYDRTLVAQTSDQAAAWVSTGLKTMALAGGPYALPAGDYFAGWWHNGTTSPGWVRASGISNIFINAGLASPNIRFGSADAGLTATAPATMGTQNVQANAWWVALS